MFFRMHYYNPSLITGIKDSSGVRVTFASQLRTYDAAGQGSGGYPSGIEKDGEHLWFIVVYNGL